MMPGDVTFTVRVRYSCARAACGDDLVVYEVVLMFNSLVYINVTQ